MHVFALSALFLFASQTWIVDDDGPADFATIGAAVASPSVVDGDTLYVESGQYPGFTLDKALSIVARSGDHFSAATCTVQNVADFTIAGMWTRTLDVQGVSGRGQIDDSRVGLWLIDDNSGELYWSGRASIAGCGELVVTRTVFHGSEGLYPDQTDTEPAAVVSTSNVALVDCVFQGGNDEVHDMHPTEGPKPALWVRSQSFAIISGCTLIGGRGIASLTFEGAPALVVDGSEARVRGSSHHMVRGGWGYSGYAPAITGVPSSTATVSGVRCDAALLPAWASQPATPEPYFRILPADDVGSRRTVEVYGPSGTEVRVFFALVPQYLPDFMPGLDPLWVDRGAVLDLISVVCAGQDVPVTFAFPASGAGGGPGDATIFQGFAPSLSGVGRFLTNPEQIVSRR